MEELKPCPFCGCEASVDVDDYGHYFVGCDEDCRCPCNIFYTNKGYFNEEEAIKAWNTRYEPPFNGSVPAGNERLKKCV